MYSLFAYIFTLTLKIDNSGLILVKTVWNFSSQEPAHMKNTVALIFPDIQCLHLMYSEVAWVLLSSGT